MTTNQTIDGVPRDLLSRLLAWLNRANELNGDGDIAEYVELRALLYAPEKQSEIDSLRAEVEKWKGIAGRRTAERTEFMNERDDLRDAIAQAIGGDTYDCVRVWSAWGVGTMSEDDFVPVVDQEARLYEIADACLDEVYRLNKAKD